MDYAASAAPNPSSIHILGLEAKQKLENARNAVAGILNARKDEVIFTSGGTEGNNIAIQGVLLASQMPHIVTTNIEHPSVLETVKLLEKRGLAEATIVPVEENGIVDPKKVKKAIKENTVLISVMYANNEIGTVQPIKEIAKEIRHYKKQTNQNIFFHTDAVQAANYLDLNVERLGVDLLTLSGSKIEGAGKPARNSYGLASAGGVGVLYKNKSLKLEPIYGGGDQEQGVRPGTENLEAIIKFAEAFIKVRKDSEKENKRLYKLQKYFLEKIAKLKVVVNGDIENRLPNNLNITIPKIPSDLLVIELSARGVMTSSKSACKSSREEGSYVIEALRPNSLSSRQVGDPEIGGVRLSFGTSTTKKEIDYALKSLSEILKKLEKWYK